MLRATLLLSLLALPHIGLYASDPVADKKAMSLQDLGSLLASHAQAVRTFQAVMVRTTEPAKPGDAPVVTHYCLSADPLSSHYRLDWLEMETKEDAFPFYTMEMWDGHNEVRWQRGCGKESREAVLAVLANPSDAAHAALFPVLHAGVAYTREVPHLGPRLVPYLRLMGLMYGPFTGPEMCQWAATHGGKVSVDDHGLINLSYDGSTTFTFDSTGGLKSAHVVADDGKLFEEIEVHKTMTLGGTTLPAELQVTWLLPDGRPQISEVKIDNGPRLLSEDKLTELLHPLYPKGLDVHPHTRGKGYRLSAASRSIELTLP